MTTTQAQLASSLAEIYALTIQDPYTLKHLEDEGRTIEEFKASLLKGHHATLGNEEAVRHYNYLREEFFI